METGVAESMEQKEDAARTGMEWWGMRKRWSCELKHKSPLRMVHVWQTGSAASPSKLLLQRSTFLLSSEDVDDDDVDLFR